MKKKSGIFLTTRREEKEEKSATFNTSLREKTFLGKNRKKYCC